MLLPDWLFVQEYFATIDRVELELVLELGQANTFEHPLATRNGECGLGCHTRLRASVA